LSVKITFAVAANDRGVLEGNFLSSSCFATGHPHQVIVQWNYPSAAAAYNEAIQRAEHEIIVFAHQDVFLGGHWIEQFEKSLDILQDSDPSWGVAGCYGITAERKYRGYLYSSCQAVHGAPFEQPIPVETLDEILLVIRKRSGLRFDENLPHFHLYAADICLTAAAQGMCNYAIFAPCIHNTKQNLVLPPEFYECCDYLRESKRQHLPIQTTCVSLTRFGMPLFMRRLREIYPRLVLRKSKNDTQVADVQRLVAAFDTAHVRLCHDRPTDSPSPQRDCEESLTGDASQAKSLA
jgi:hypothetical protein